MADPNLPKKGRRPLLPESSSGCGCLLLGIIVLAGVIYIAYREEIPSTLRTLFAALSGAEVTLVGEGPERNAVMLGITESAYGDGVRAIRIHDTFGYQDMLRMNRVFNIPTGTKALIIDRSLFLVEVRILEGNHVGESGWVPLSHIELRGKAH